MTLGWQCPACGTVYAPHVAACPKPHAAIVAATGGNEKPRAKAARGNSQQSAVSSTSHGVGSKASKPRVKHTYTEEFERFFKLYPNARGKFAASKRFAEALATGATAEQLCIAAAAYRDDPTRNPEKTKHCQGWLSDRRWEDDLTPVRAAAPKPDPARVVGSPEWIALNRPWEAG